MKETTTNCPVDGWERILSERKTGKTAGKFDVYFVSPEGKRLRSRREVSKYLKDNGLDISLELFRFRVRRIEDEKRFTKVKQPTQVAQYCQSISHPGSRDISLSTFERASMCLEKQVCFKCFCNISSNPLHDYRKHDYRRCNVWLRSII